MELIGMLLIAGQAGWCMRNVDRRQPIARWGSVVFLAIAWLFSLGGELLGAAFFATVASLMVMYAQNAKAKWLKKQKAGG